MKLDKPVVLTLGEKKLYQKEPANAWVYRLLGFSLEHSRLEITSVSNRIVEVWIDGADYHARLDDNRMLAFKAWLAEQSGIKPGGSAVGCVITNPARDMFILQRKDHLVPYKGGVERFTIFGGRQNQGEDPLESMMREWYEEACIGDVADEIAARMIERGSRALPMIGAGEFVWHWYSAQAENVEQFNRWVLKLLLPGATSEAQPAILPRDFVLRMAAEEEKVLGRYFIGSVQKLLLVV